MPLDHHWIGLAAALGASQVAVAISLILAIRNPPDPLLQSPRSRGAIAQKPKTCALSEIDRFCLG